MDFVGFGHQYHYGMPWTDLGQAHDLSGAYCKIDAKRAEELLMAYGGKGGYYPGTTVPLDGAGRVACRDVCGPLGMGAAGVTCVDALDRQAGPVLKIKPTCYHGVRKGLCVLCKEIYACPHRKYKKKCVKCGGADICKHGKMRRRCKECDGVELCATPLCLSKHKGPSFKHRCYPCAIRAFPDENFPVSRQFRVKERAIVDEIKTRFPQYDWVLDKPIEGGCSSARPDILCQLGTHVLIVEVDEHAHRSRSMQCEMARLNSLCMDLNFQRMVTIRFNPDAYTDAAGVRHHSCFHMNKRGFQVVRCKKAFDERLAVLFERIEHHAAAVPTELLVVEYLFYG